MPYATYQCAGCHKSISNSEPAKVFSEPGHPPRFFHSANTECFRNWRIKMLRKELLQLEMRVDTLNQHEDWDDVRVNNGG
jgi:hypothetical protein